MTVGRQVRARAGRERYEPLVRFGGLPCFPSAPLADQLDRGADIAGQPLESHFCDWPDAETRVLRDGEDFDVLVFAIPLGHGADRLPRADRGPARVARDGRARHHHGDPGRAALAARGRAGARLARPGRDGERLRAAAAHLGLDAAAHRGRGLAADERPGSIAYFCGALEAPWPPARRRASTSRSTARTSAPTRWTSSSASSATCCRERRTNGAFRWDLLCGRDGHAGSDAIDTQLYLANVDPSDRYVQCVPGSDAYRLRADESGYDNLFLAGDWTDCGLNAGCIEAATISGLQAGNAVLGRSRGYRIAGYWPA